MEWKDIISLFLSHMAFLALGAWMTFIPMSKEHLKTMEERSDWSNKATRSISILSNLLVALKTAHGQGTLDPYVTDAMQSAIFLSTNSHLSRDDEELTEEEIKKNLQEESNND